MPENDTEAGSIELATELTIAWLSNPNTKAEAGDVAAVLRQMHDAVKSLSEPPEVEDQAAAEQHVRAVSVRKSLASKDHIISLIDGKPYKTLRRHLSGHGLTPDDYRARYGLKPDYPMVSESYSQARREMAKKIGLGRKPGQKPAAKKAAQPKRRGRPTKTA
jgi:predicted transcriptional regulator